MKEYEKEQFDYQNYWYFLEENRFFRVPKNQDITNYEKKYFLKTASNLFDYLFCDKKSPFQQTHFYFLAINIESIQSSQIANVITFFQELLIKSDYLVLKGHLVYYYYEKKDFDLIDIIPSLNEDFNSNLVLFESGPINQNDPNKFKVIFNTYLSYYEKHPNQYMNQTKLVLGLAQNQPNQLCDFSSVLLKSILEDDSLFYLVNMLLENNLNVTKTAKKAYMHRNTINNKIEYIQKETGFQIQKFIDAMAVYFLLKWK